MNKVIQNTINELHKLFLKKKILVLLVLTAILSFLPAFFISAIQAKLIFISLDSVSYPLIMLSVITNMLLPLYIFVSAAELFPGEVGDKTIKLVLSRPISRFKIYLSKISALFIYAIINLLVVFMVTTVSAIILKLNSQEIGHILLSYIIDVLPAMVLIIFSAFVVQFFKSSSAALVSSILIFIGIRVVALFIKGLNNALFTSYLNWYPMWSLNGNSILRVLNTFFMITAYGIIFFTIGCYTFDKKEF